MIELPDFSFSPIEARVDPAFGPDETFLMIQQVMDDMPRWIERDVKIMEQLAARGALPGVPKWFTDPIRRETQVLQRRPRAPVVPPRDPRDYPQASECTVSGELRVWADGELHKAHSPLLLDLRRDGMLKSEYDDLGLWTGDRITPKGRGAL